MADSKIYFEQGKNYNICEESEVKVTTFNDGSFIVKNSSKKPNNLKNFKKIDKNTYVDITTGEIKVSKRNNKKTVSNIKETMNRLKKILKNNFTGEKNELFITLTCEEKVTDYNDMHELVKSFFNKLTKLYEGLVYVYVLELQERESWHLHGLIKDKLHKTLYIDNNEIEQLWGKGHTQTLGIKEIVSRLWFQENTKRSARAKAIDKVIDYIAKVDSKEDTPQNKNLYYTSKGIERPKTYKMQYKQFKETLGKNAVLTKETTILAMSYTTGNIVNKHKTEKWENKGGGNNEED